MTKSLTTKAFTTEPLTTKSLLYDRDSNQGSFENRQLNAKHLLSKPCFVAYVFLSAGEVIKDKRR